MKYWFLATALLFLSAGLASADYVIIVANLGPSKEKTQTGTGMSGFRGGFPGGFPGGRPPFGAGGGGLQGGAVGGRPGYGNRGGPPSGGGGIPGVPTGTVMGGGVGIPGMGGVPGMMGTRGGMMGMRGGIPSPGMGEPRDVDDVPYFIIAVVEVEPTSGTLLKKLTDTRIQMPSAKVKHKWGASTLLAKTGFCETIVLTQDKDQKPLATVSKRFNDKFAKIFKDKPTAELVLELANWTLVHGLVDKFPRVMDKLLEIDRNHPAAVAYLKIKADLDKPPARDDAGASWRNKLLNGYKVTETDHHHYVIVHNSATGGTAEVQSQLDLLENSFRGFYYWFVLKGIALPVPNQRQLAVVTSQEKDFDHFHKILTSGPVVVDGFFARRESVSVMSAERMDESYGMLKKAWANFGDHGFKRTDILSGKKGAGHPKTARQEDVALAQMVALMLKALENEAELATISHDASRQLLFASGLVPRNVAAPEWIQFGMGSFFETPLQSPWPGIGAPSAYNLPRWHELKGKDFEKSPGDTLVKVVSDAYFRNLPPKGGAESPTRQAHDAALRKARVASWSLTYFLAKDEQQFPRLMRYFKELSKMPRDIELDDEVLLGCFARAFGAVDANNKVDKSKLSALANQWYSYMDNVKFEWESTMKQIREVFKKRLAESQGDEKQSQPGGNPPGIFPPNGGNPGGNRPPIVPRGRGGIPLGVGGVITPFPGSGVRPGY